MSRGNGGVVGVTNNTSKSAASGIWSLSEQFSSRKSNTWPISRVPFSLTISSNTRNVNAKNLAIAAGYNGISPINLTLTINSGVILGSTSTANPALNLTGFPADSLINLTVGTSAYVAGAGGAGAAGQAWSTTVYPAGGNGGNAIVTDIETVITNLGTIGGGGGGGGGGNGYAPDGSYGAQGGNGGGGAGDVAAGSATLTTGANGTGGEIAPGGPFKAGDGGKGGNLGVAGNAGEDKPANFNGSNPAPGAGGAAGNYIVGNAYVTWVTTGTRLGNVS